MYNFTMFLQDAQDVKAMQAWCKAQGIECKVVTAVEMPVLPSRQAQAPTQVAPAQKPKASKALKYKLNAEDVEVKITSKRGIATLDKGVKRDTFAVLKADAQALGGEWDKDAQGFKFAKAEDAKKFAARTKVLGTERNAVRKEWNLA
jgi:hypothetical protein